MLTMKPSKLEPIVTKAFRKECRKIVGRQKGGTITRMKLATGAGCDWSVDASVDTACWSWAGKHIIKCGLRLHEFCNTSTRLSDAKMKKFAETIIRHETEHGMQSDRTSAVSDACADKKIPFRLWNLFEDCRIEYASAIRMDGDGAFRWVNFQDVEDNYNIASTMMWAIKTNEAGIKKSPSASVPKWDGADEMLYHGREKKTRLIILDFYRRIIHSNSSMDLIPICEEWVKIFGVDVTYEGASDNINGARDPDAPMVNGKADREGQFDDPAPSEEKEQSKWRTKRNAMNDKQIARVSRSLNQVIQNAKVVKNRLNCNGSKLDANQAMQGAEKAFRNRGRTNGKRSVTFIVDQSGSMEGTYRNHGGKELLLAFRKLARENKIDLEILLTQEGWGAKSYRVKDGDTDMWLNNLCPDGGGEQIMRCMKRFDKIIKASTTSVIFTDACLCDNDIDTQQYRNMGLNTIACYIEPNPDHVRSGRSQMNEHFARSVIATEVNELARRLMREILKD